MPTHGPLRGTTAAPILMRMSEPKGVAETLLQISVFAVLLFNTVAGTGCSAAVSETANAATSKATTAANANGNSTETSAGPRIEIEPGSPAETVKAFYERLKEKRYREAIHLTNLKPAIEGLTDDELREFAVDLEAVAKAVPADVRINGEIISGDSATVTAALPEEIGEEPEMQEIRLRKVNGFWQILAADEVTEARIKKEGKNFFYELRIDVRQNEAKEMLERVAKAQLAFSLQNKGQFAEVEKLIELGYVPDDIRSSESTGYVYRVVLIEGGKTYFATATPAEYAKSGRNSYLLEPSAAGPSKVIGRDNSGKPLRE